MSAAAGRAVWAVVPAKGFERGKSRLAGVLPGGARAAFARGLFEHVLGELFGSGALAGVLVATDSEAVAGAARARGAEARMDGAGRGTLAAVVDGALRDVAERGAGAALVLMADLPRLTARDVCEVIEALSVHDVVVVPDVHGRHTNALALAPPTRLRTRFGAAESFAEHCAAARAASLRLAVIENPRIAFDVDDPADHARL